MKSLINWFLPDKSENYQKAKTGIKNVMKKFDGFAMSFPDITSEEIIFIKDKWRSLPKSISKGVKIMALEITENYKSLITEYNPNAYIKPHKHADEYEHGIILKGVLIDKFRNTTYNVGDVYTIAPDKIHYLSSSNDGCLVYSKLTHNKSTSLKPLPEKVISELELT
jgi:quercetin dioxygenase-like cupin family protein